jgi:hypothetical protein
VIRNRLAYWSNVATVLPSCFSFALNDSLERRSSQFDTFAMAVMRVETDPGDMGCYRQQSVTLVDLSS